MYIREDAPNPQFVREPWVDLTGAWKFRYDESDCGLDEGWWRQRFDDLDLNITVPYPPESELSGIGDPGFHAVVWYQRELPAPPVTSQEKTLIHFGAVDYHATVWIADRFVGEHAGGSSPFTIDIETSWLRSLERAFLTLRVFDSPTDKEQPRGKQAWTELHADIWYKRTTGIWQPVWMEFVPEISIDQFRYVFDSAHAMLGVEIELNRHPHEQTDATITIAAPDGHQVTATISGEQRVLLGDIDLTRLSPHGAIDHLLWSPQHPNLMPLSITTSQGDIVQSYVGLRNVELDQTGFRINGLKTWLRMVLSQGYFPQSHYAAPSSEAIRREVELTLALGFNGARTHQKAEDPRYLYWADKLGLLLWGEIGAAYEWSDRALASLISEWREIVRRDRNHPSIIAWVPFNESWGIHEVQANIDQQEAVRSVYALTKSLDATRPVIGNDGWEHVATDILTLHDYVWHGNDLTSRYGSGRSTAEITRDFATAGKSAVAGPLNTDELPVMITEYGGVSFAPVSDEQWYGYGKVSNDQEFAQKYDELTSALHASNKLIGCCYTQLTDTEQETNGLLTEDRQPKLDIALLRAITQGDKN